MDIKTADRRLLVGGLIASRISYIVRHDEVWAEKANRGTFFHFVSDAVASDKIRHYPLRKCEDVLQSAGSGA